MDRDHDKTVQSGNITTLAKLDVRSNEHARIAAATVSVVQAISGWLRVGGGYDQASIREAKKACGCGNGTRDWTPDINWRIPSNLPTAMAHRRRLDARAHALPENSPIWE